MKKLFHRSLILIEQVAALEMSVIALRLHFATLNARYLKVLYLGKMLNYIIDHNEYSIFFF